MKYLLFFLLFISITLANSQVTKINIDKDSSFIERVSMIEKGNNILKEELKKIKLNDSLKAIDIKQLNKSVDNAQKIINVQNTYINLYQILFGIIIVLSGLAYFFNVRPLTKRVENSLDKAEAASEKLDSRIENFNDDIDAKLKNRFEEYDIKQQEMNIEEMFRDISSNSIYQKNSQLEKLAQLPVSKINSDKVTELFNLLNRADYLEEDKTKIVEVLIQKDSAIIKDFFKSWVKVKADNEYLKGLLYNYYLFNEITNYFYPITTFILDYATQYKEFQKVLLHLPSHPHDMYKLINYEPLIKSLERDSVKKIKLFINDNIEGWSLLDKEKVQISLLYKV